MCLLDKIVQALTVVLWLCNMHSMLMNERDISSKVSLNRNARKTRLGTD